MLEMVRLSSQETADRGGSDKLKFMQIMMSDPLSCRRVQDPEVTGELDPCSENPSTTARDGLNESCETRVQHRDGLDKGWNRWKSLEEQREGLTGFKHRDGLSNVVKECMQNIINREKQRRHMRTIENEETDATLHSGAACCVCPRDLCNDVPIRQCPDSRRGMMLRTAGGQNVVHEGTRTIVCSIEYGFAGRLTGAATPVQKILLAVSRLAETSHQVQFNSTGGCIVNERNGSNIPVHWKNGFYTIELWVKGERYDQNKNPTKLKSWERCREATSK